MTFGLKVMKRRATTNLKGIQGCINMTEKNFRIAHFLLKQNQGKRIHYSISTTFVRSKNGTVWFGTYGALIGYNGSDFKIINDEYLGLNEETGLCISGA